MRERSEEYCRQLQVEVRSRTTSDLGSSSSLGMSSDSSRLELDRIEVSPIFASFISLSNYSSHPIPFARSQVQFSEKLNQHQSRYNIELSSLREQLHDADAHKEMLQRELQQAREKLDSSRLESLTDSEETISELRKRHDRELKIVVDDNRKLIAELEMLSENNRRMQSDRMQIDSEYEELR